MLLVWGKLRRRNAFKLAATYVMLSLGALLSRGAYGQGALEEIVVTATFRAESLQDVPLSVTALSPETIDSIGAYRMHDLNGIVPNVQIKEQHISNSLSVRGIHSAGNQGFEQSVGFFRDGIYIGKAHLSRLPFMDLEQVVVLRGPQGTLFGKNTVAGAIAIQTRKPEDDFDYGIDTQIALDDNTDYALTGYINSGFSDAVRGRLVARYRDSEGWLTNTAEGNRQVPQREEHAIRGSLEWDMSENVILNATYEHAVWDRVGRATQIVATQNAAVYADAVLDDNVLFTNSDPAGLFVGTDRASDFSDSDADLAVLKLVAELGGGFSLESTTGYAAYTTDEAHDGDFGPLALISAVQEEDYSQISTELRLLSPIGSRFSYILGFYYEDNEFSFDEQVDLALPPTGFTKFVTDFDKDHETISVFGQLYIDINDNLGLTGTVRYSAVDQYATQRQYVSSITPVGNTMELDPSDPANAGIFGFYAAALNIVPHDSSGSRSEDGVDWSTSLEYAFGTAGDHSGYITVAEGFKAGGFDARRAQPEGFAGSDDTFEFEDETALTFEVGLKSSLLDGRMRWNTSLFSTQYSGQQQSVFLGGVTFAVLNAADATIEGFESEAQFQATDSLNIWGNLAYLDFEYDSYPTGPCTQPQILTWPDPGACRQDLTGGTGPNAPEWNGAIGFNYDRPLANGMTLKASGVLSYVDEFFTEADLDPNVLQPSFSKIDLQIGVSSANDKWYVGILCKNLTDEITTYHRNDVPLNAGTYYATTEPPRTFYLMARYSN